jgi:3-phosphoshikimate 1-carboxyvinyltransferase
MELPSPRAPGPLLGRTVAERVEESATEIRPPARLRGRLTVPGDKSISHRALMLALLSEGRSSIAGASDGADVRSTAAIVEALGGSVVRRPGGGAGVDYEVRSPGMDGLRRHPIELDCGNSGTTLRLFAGILAGQPVRAILDGDASLRRRPMARIAAPLRAMGAGVESSAGDVPPITVLGRRELQPIDWPTAVPSAQVKSAILLAGLRAAGTTTVRETVATRDHTERMLRARGVPVRSTVRQDGGMTVELDGRLAPTALDERVPGDPSAAAFWLVAALIHPSADLQLDSVGVNPTRRGAIDALRRMGAHIDERPVDGRSGVGDAGEPIATLRATSSELEAIELDEAATAGAIDEIPILCLAATQARGQSVFRGVGELRHKESDRVAGIVDGLRAMGATIEAREDNLHVEGPTTLQGALVRSLGDHRLAMTFAIAGLIASGRTRISDPESVDISYPSFFSDLERIQS